MIIEAGALLALYSVLFKKGGKKLKTSSPASSKASHAIQADDETTMQQCDVCLAKKTCIHHRKNQEPEPVINAQSVPSSQSSHQLSISKDSKEINRNLKIGAITLSLAGIRQFVFAPIAPIYLGFFAYQNYQFFKRTVISLRDKRKVGYDANVLTIQTLGIAFNQYFMVSLAVFVYFVSDKVISLTQKQSQKLIANSFKDLSKTAWCLQDGVEIEMPLDRVKSGDLVVVSAGEFIPVDGVVESGAGLVDQHSLTGEAQLAEKGNEDAVFATTMLMSGRLFIRTEKTGADTTAANIDQILNQSVDYKSQLQQKGEVWADKGVLPFFGLASIAAVTGGVSPALAVLTAHFGSRIRILAPLGTLGYLNKASKLGVLIKSGSTLESIREIDTVLFDKTGTLTNSELSVVKIVSWSGSEQDILAFAAVAQGNMEHPIANAIREKAKREGTELPQSDYSEYKIGFGVSLSIDENEIHVGSERFMHAQGIEIPEPLTSTMEKAYNIGHSLVMVVKNNKLLGFIELQSVVRTEVHDLMAKLREHGIKEIAIVSGDREQTTRQLAEQLEMDNYFHDVLPTQKADIVTSLQQQGKKVCFIGDGVNDAIAMRNAEVSVSLAGASSIATDVADVILMDGTLYHFSDLFDLSKDLSRNLNHSLSILMVPAALLVPGAIFLGAGFGTALIVKNMLFLAGLSNAVHPLYKSHKLNQPLLKAP